MISGGVTTIARPFRTISSEPVEEKGQAHPLSWPHCETSAAASDESRRWTSKQLLLPNAQGLEAYRPLGEPALWLGVSALESQGK